MTDPREIGVELTLAELEERYTWVGEELAAAHAAGKIKSTAVRWFIERQQPILLDENGDPEFDVDGDPMYDWEKGPFFYGRAQAYSYLGKPPNQTIAGQSDLPLGLLDQAERQRGRFLDILCSDLNEHHAHELARATGQPTA